MKAPFTRLLQRFGLRLPRLSRSLVLLAADTAAAARALAALEPLLARRPGHALILAVSDRALAKRLRREQRLDYVLPRPRVAGWGGWRRALRPAAVLLLPGCPSSEAERRRLRRLGQPLLAGWPDEPAVVAALEERLATLPAGAGRHEGLRRPGLLARLADGPFAARLDRAYANRTLASWQELADRLGQPRRILCLGNGPSSLAPEAAAADFDCLFRVNWRWAKEPATPQPLRRAALVFVGSLETLWRLPQATFALRWRGEARLARLKCLLRGRPRQAGFTAVVLEAAAPELMALDLGARPTNGAWMVAVAAALQPERLLLGGLDLYSHPDGRYPWTGLGPNAYARVHAREADLRFIALALAGYRGEVVHLSPLLAEALAALPAESSLAGAGASGQHPGP